MTTVVGKSFLTSALNLRKEYTLVVDKFALVVIDYPATAWFWRMWTKVILLRSSFSKGYVRRASLDPLKEIQSCYSENQLTRLTTNVYQEPRLYICNSCCDVALHRLSVRETLRRWQSYADGLQRPPAEYGGWKVRIYRLASDGFNQTNTNDWITFMIEWKRTH